ncbi:N-acetylneuraminate synthase [Succinivibrio dextrinosolvens DSM 3072]|uniref:N-acetylneuraminate synthase n=1 Tax=Succinivibrio dextrinosolvens DSM 3072 TaxID=1123324 RepID=A0A1T4VCJ8_9GAMM|nr:N-acetylneuraminate synthase family protein [Succinivibrio dextrinosolvens]SKA62680.1 N-acetylneuraminate synthase [Succinivibrio dextrinosolvens DSM 3072]
MMKQNKPYLIAEIGVNFYDTAKIMEIKPLDAAKLYIKKAADSGVDCVKFQSYKANTLASKNSPAYWDTTKESTKSQYELFSKFDGFYEDDYLELSKYAHSLDVDFTSTPFDYTSADYLEKMVDFYKISSSDLSNLPFISYIGAKGKPVVLSTGASYISEIDEAVRTLQDSGCEDISLLHCVLSYPTSSQNANLNIIKGLKKIYPKLKIGYSDHVMPDECMTTLTTAYLLGAEIIEKHFTLDKKLKGNDHYHAGDPKDFKRAVDNFKLVNKLLGSEDKTVLDCEIIPRKEARRSLVLTRNIKQGETIETDDLIAKRPGTGISPKYTNIVIGRKALVPLNEDEILTWDKV